MDIDLCGPSIPYLLGLEDKDVHQSSEGWIPVYADEEQNLAVMSLGFIIKNREQSVVWRGPKKTGVFKIYNHRGDCYTMSLFSTQIICFFQ